MNKNKWFLNGGRGSGRSFRLLCETYENKIADLEKENTELKVKADKCLHLADVRLEQELETYQKLHITSREKLDTEIALDEVKKQLTNAKEIIKALLNVFVYDLADDEMDVGHIDTKTKAEQFLKKVEKND